MNEMQNQPAHSRDMPADAAHEDEIDLAQLWALLWGAKYWIVTCVVVAILCAVGYLLVAQPTYRADALLQIQPETQSPLQGITSGLDMLTGKNTSPAQSAIPIIKSRSVLGKAVKQLNLTTRATPDHFPLIGQAIARRSEAGQPASQAVAADQGSWLSHYAWQPVAIDVARMDVPQTLHGKPFTLRALGAGQYVLFGPQGNKVLAGVAGKPVSGTTAQGAQIKLFVRSLSVAEPPTDFTLNKRTWLPTVKGLEKRLSVSEQGDQTGILKLSLEGTRPAHITQVVNQIANDYLKQNVEAKSQQAQKSLAFLDKQLPQLKQDVQTAETKLANYRESKQTIDLSAEGQALLDQVVNIEDKRSQLKLKLSELKQKFTGQHPMIKAVKEQLQSLEAQRNKVEQHVGKLPRAQKEILRLRRDVKVNTQLYTALLNRAQELRIAKAGTVGNVRIVDHAVKPVRAVAPKKKLVLVLAIVLGGMLGVGLVFMRAALRRMVDDPKELEKQLGVPVYAVVPFSKWLIRHSQRYKRRGIAVEPVLARDQSQDICVEALRSLRTSLYFAQMESGSNVILLTGPAPEVGKSFIGMNLAWLLSQSGQSVAVVDADMRKGMLHTYLPEQAREPGLSQVLSGQVAVADALQTLPDADVHVLPSGQLPPNPSELLMRESLVATIDTLKTSHDVVIIDAPPILAVTDAAIMQAAIPGVVTFMVVRAGAHPLQEIEAAIDRMSHKGAQIAGLVFNGYSKTHADNAGGYHYYQYDYKPSGA